MRFWPLWLRNHRKVASLHRDNLSITILWGGAILVAPKSQVRPYKYICYLSEPHPTNHPKKQHNFSTPKFRNPVRRKLSLRLQNNGRRKIVIPMVVSPPSTYRLVAELDESIPRTTHTHTQQKQLATQTMSKKKSGQRQARSTSQTAIFLIISLSIFNQNHYFLMDCLRGTSPHNFCWPI